MKKLNQKFLRTEPAFGFLFMAYLLLIFIFLFGLTIGSFLNCLVWRLHTGESMGGRSRCPKCKHQIAWYDNLPVLSFILLRGRCRHCGKKISWQYPLVEFITGVLFVVVFILDCKLNIINCLQITNYKLQISLFRDFFLVSVMIIIFIYDLRWYLILDKVTFPAMAVVIILNLLLGLNWQNLLFSGIIGGSFFLFQFIISRGKWVGGGDIRLGLLMGLVLGWKMLLLALFLAYLMGSIIGLGLIIGKKKHWGSQIPFGVFLSPATLIALFWGEQILNWYLNFFRF